MDGVLIWGRDQQEQDTGLQTVLKTLQKAGVTSPPVLTLYDPKKELKLSADASSCGLGAVVLQKEEIQWKPVACASRSLTESEQRDAQVEEEARGLRALPGPHYRGTFCHSSAR